MNIVNEKMGEAALDALIKLFNKIIGKYYNMQII